MLLRHFTFSLWFFRGVCIVDCGIDLFSAFHVFLIFFATFEFEILMPPTLVFKIIMPPFFMPPPEDLKSLCHPTFMPPPKNLMPPRLCHPGGWHKKTGGGVKKKKNNAHNAHVTLHGD